ncbi:helix-turn-helix transcriptional regulator [Amycolatopsis sp. Poz14]|uniref:helix-turn-helix domain-containing protein n=1 Tax=Amycolatopsis sp. Poz14 TaxID=1447705 RepID=UPI001EE933C3|nr:helix-turn-helix transcriptional regulator [Amycolatopsis sp. Poz14]MCG3757397.1 helix-turn-helix transcriptional regulator [Amycolatopsis sp. Poz14]
MNGQLEHLIGQLNTERLDRGMKWTGVAGELHISPQHLLRIRRGQSPISEEVAAAIDRFLRRAVGTTARQTAGAEVDTFLRQPAGTGFRQLMTGNPPDATDEELAGMSPREIARLAVWHGKAHGDEARQKLLQRAVDIHRKTLDTLASQVAEDNEHS